MSAREALPIVPSSGTATVLATVSPSASTVKPVIVIVPIVRSPDPSIVVAPAIAPALVIPPELLSKESRVVALASREPSD